MHKNHAKDGLAVVSVSLDAAKKKDKVLKFLKDKGASFTNFLLDEEDDDWQKLLDITGPPLVIVYNREGKIEKQFKDEFEQKDVDKVVEELLKKK